MTRRTAALCRATATTATFALSAALSANQAFAQAVDILQQNVTVDLRGSGTEIYVDAELEATSPATGFDLYLPALPIEEVLVDGIPATFGPHPTDPDFALRIDYPELQPTGKAFTLSIRLAGEVMTCNVLEFPGAVGCKRSAEETIFMPSSPGHAWHLINMHRADSFTGSVRVLVPAPLYVVAGQGHPESVDDLSPTERVWTFRFDQPTEHLVLYAGQAEVLTHPGTIPVRGIVPLGYDAMATMSDASVLGSDLIPALSSFLTEAPFDAASIVRVPIEFPFNGMGLVGTVLLNEKIVGELDFKLEQEIAHEFAHSWWGGVASAARADEAFVIQEAFAEYSAWRAIGLLRGDDVRTSGSRMNAVWYMYRRPGDTDVAPLSPELGNPAIVFAVYHKSSTVLRTLEEMAGQEAFTRAIATMLSGGYASLTVAGLEQSVLDECGKDISPHVDQWLRQPGYPEIRVSTHVDETEDGFLATLIVDTAGAFTFEAPLRITSADGSVFDTSLSLEPGESEHRVALPFRPASIELDPRWTLVREVLSEIPGDVTLDGEVDGADLIEVALRSGGFLPLESRLDGRYDRLYDVNDSKTIDAHDLRAIADKR